MSEIGSDFPSCLCFGAGRLALPFFVSGWGRKKAGGTLSKTSGKTHEKTYTTNLMELITSI